MTIAELDPPRSARARRVPAPRLHVAPLPREHSVIINLRAPAHARELIDSAAAVEGKSRTEFMLDSACRHARDVLLDQRIFVLEGDKFDELMRLLDSPPPPNGALRRLLLSKSPWEK